MINGLSKMYEIVAENARLLLVLERFNISLGFGEQTVHEICKRYNITDRLFLTIANLYCCKDAVIIDAQQFDTTDAYQVLKYLKASHVYFLDEKIPRLKMIIEQKEASVPTTQKTEAIGRQADDSRTGCSKTTHKRLRQQTDIERIEYQHSYRHHPPPKYHHETGHQINRGINDLWRDQQYH